MASDFTVDVVGFDQFERALGGLLPRIVQAGFEILPDDVQTHILEPSQEIVPYLSGDLHDSGHVSDPIEVGEAVALTVGYGGDNGEVFYALDQHENEQYEHAPGKSDKFLEKPVLEWTKTGPERVARKIAKAVAS